jgi:Major tropism determinant N-terminal domain
MRISAEFTIKRGFSFEWTEKNPVLRAGEPGYEIDRHRLKIGDGATPWEHLTYVNMGEASVPSPELFAHLVDETPHPVYDDGPDWDVIYQNAKV